NRHAWNQAWPGQGPLRPRAGQASRAWRPADRNRLAGTEAGRRDPKGQLGCAARRIRVAGGAGDVPVKAEPSWRKPAGIFAILALIALWAAAIASLSGEVGRWPIWLQSIFYIFTGIVWILPLKPLLRWMEPGRFRARNPPSVP